MSALPNLFSFNLPELEAFLEGLGQKKFRARQIFMWLHQKGEMDLEKMTDVAQSLKNLLKEKTRITPLKFSSETKSLDGSIKFLWAVQGGAVESVLIPEEKRQTLCLSTQVGCALECAFCCTGKQGFSRNLSTDEIIGQLWGVKERLNDWQKRKITNVVLMGMGEPLANFENTVRALDVFLSDYAYGLSRRKVTLSTSGIVPMMDKLALRAPVALAVSLHAATDELRDRLVPLNQKYPLKMLLEASRRYLKFAPRDFITFEYTLIHNVNDSEEDAQKLVRLLRNVPSKLNLIAFNPFLGSAFEAPKKERVEAFLKVLQNENLVVTLRKARGDDIAAACGQLAGKVHNRKKAA